MKNILLGMTLVVASLGAQAKPTSESVQDVLNYYYNGQGQGAVLFETKLCGEIVKEGENKNECGNPITGPIEKGGHAYVWMAYMVPQGDEVSNILLQSNFKGITRSTQTVSVKGAVRYRTWKKVKFNKAGAWELKIIEDADDVSILKTMAVNVVDTTVAAQ